MAAGDKLIKSLHLTNAKRCAQVGHSVVIPKFNLLVVPRTSSNYVEAGAFASVYSSPEDVAKQSIELIDALLTKEYVHQEHLPEYCTVKFNETVAWHLDLSIPVELEKNTGPCDL